MFEPYTDRPLSGLNSVARIGAALYGEIILMKTALEIVHDGLARGDTRLMLIGAYALQAYGVVRQTLDLDCLVADQEEGSLRAVLCDAGYVEEQRAEAFIRYSHPSVWFMDVDVMTVDGGTFDKMFAQSCECEVQSLTARVPCLLHLIALKLHAVKHNPKRELKDLGDIVELLRANPRAVSDRELSEVCERYGPAGIRDKLGRHL